MDAKQYCSFGSFQMREHVPGVELFYRDLSGAESYLDICSSSKFPRRRLARFDLVASFSMEWGQQIEQPDDRRECRGCLRFLHNPSALTAEQITHPHELLKGRGTFEVVLASWSNNGGRREQTCAPWNHPRHAFQRSDGISFASRWFIKNWIDSISCLFAVSDELVGKREKMAADSRSRKQICYRDDSDRLMPPAEIITEKTKMLIT